MKKLSLYLLLLPISIVSLVAQCPYDTIDCAECCKAGRTVSSECCKACNNCCMYNDEACAECKDFPNGG